CADQTGPRSSRRPGPHGEPDDARWRPVGVDSGRRPQRRGRNPEHSGDRDHQQTDRRPADHRAQFQRARDALPRRDDVDGDRHRWGGLACGPIVRNRMFYFGGIERLDLNSTDVLGISDYWRQLVPQTVIPTGEKETVGIVKVDLNANDRNRAYVRYTNTHRR